MWTKEAVDLYFEAMNEALKLDSTMPSVINIGDAIVEVDRFNKYVDAWKKRVELEERFPGSEIFNSTEFDKRAWNNSMVTITMFEESVVDTPIYDKLVEKHGVEMFSPWPKFLTDTAEGKPKRSVKSGWYQNLRAELFHYNGDVWDRGVPAERDEELEFLGGK
jgi:hypothetical protein